MRLCASTALRRRLCVSFRYDKAASGSANWPQQWVKTMRLKIRRWVSLLRSEIASLVGCHTVRKVVTILMFLTERS